MDSVEKSLEEQLLNSSPEQDKFSVQLTPELLKALKNVPGGVEDLLKLVENVDVVAKKKKIIENDPPLDFEIWCKLGPFSKSTQMEEEFKKLEKEFNLLCTAPFAKQFCDPATRSLSKSLSKIYTEAEKKGWTGSKQGVTASTKASHSSFTGGILQIVPVNLSPPFSLLNITTSSSSTTTTPSSPDLSFTPFYSPYQPIRYQEPQELMEYEAYDLFHGGGLKAVYSENMKETTPYVCDFDLEIVGPKPLNLLWIFLVLKMTVEKVLKPSFPKLSPEEQLYHFASIGECSIPRTRSGITKHGVHNAYPNLCIPVWMS